MIARRLLAPARGARGGARAGGLALLGVLLAGCDRRTDTASAKAVPPGGAGDGGRGDHARRAGAGPRHRQRAGPRHRVGALDDQRRGDEGPLPGGPGGRRGLAAVHHRPAPAPGRAAAGPGHARPAPGDGEAGRGQPGQGHRPARERQGRGAALQEAGRRRLRRSRAVRPDPHHRADAAAPPSRPTAPRSRPRRRWCGPTRPRWRTCGCSSPTPRSAPRSTAAPATCCCTRATW